MGYPLVLSYQEIGSLAEIFLEDSFVLDIEVRPGSATFAMEFVLTPDHKDFQPPAPGTHHCYRRGWLRFTGVTRCLWSNQGAPPARDANGELDFGNIDFFEWDDAGYVVEGDWGRMELVAENVQLTLD